MQTPIKFYGDPVVPSEWSGIYLAGQICEVPVLKFNPMSTAIVRIYTREGFVIAADGRRLNNDRTLFSDTAQKIFPIESPGRSLAYAMAGVTHIPGEVGEMPFDFISEAQEVIKDFVRRRPADLHRYVEIVSRRINGRLSDAKEAGRIHDYPSPEDQTPGRPGTTIVQFYFIGYFEGSSSRTDVRLFHRNQVLASPMISSPKVQLGHFEISGSDVVADLLFQKRDSRFAPYIRTAPPRPQDTTLAEAVEVARNYIRACSDPIGKTVDERCEGIGGHIHIATIKPNEGFEWVDPPFSGV